MENKNTNKSKITEMAKVKLKNLKPNPFRNFEQYPINEEKVKQLQTSMSETGFWENILCRKRDSNIEIAYGHHRLVALGNLFPPDKEITVNVKDLSDEEMVKIMGNENDERYNCLPAVVDETVKSTKEFLEKNPNSARKVLSSEGSEFKRVRIGAPIIAKFLGGNWNLTKVQESLERLKFIEQGIVNPKAVYLFPTAASTVNFAKAVKDFKIEKKFQEEIAKKLVDSKTYGQRTIKETVSTFRPRPEEDTKGDPGWASYSDGQLRKSISLIKKLIKTLGKFMNGLSEVTILEGRTTVEDISEDTLKSFNRSLNYLSDCIRKVSAKIARKEGK